MGQLNKARAKQDATATGKDLAMQELALVKARGDEELRRAGDTDINTVIDI